MRAFMIYGGALMIYRPIGEETHQRINEFSCLKGL
jgi:hypothetical protein